MKKQKFYEGSDDPRAHRIVQMYEAVRCRFCPPHEGDNKTGRFRQDRRCWKRYRNKQYERR